MQSHESTEFSCSVGDNLEKLYKDVFHEIYSHIKSQKKGVLAAVIYTLLTPNTSQAKRLCDYFQINSNLPLNDDLNISSDIIGFFLIDTTDENPFKKIMGRGLKVNVKKLRKSIGSNWESDDMKLYQIVIVGCLIVGVFACIKYLESKQTQSDLEKDDETPPPKPKTFKPVALCLVVPASVVRNVEKKKPIDAAKIKELISSSLYILCASPEEADASQERLKLANEDISNASENTEVYVRIKINDGEKMIDQTIPYILKKNLPLDERYVVTELACLKYLSNSGLENFNRV